jgi:hypothetical protein
LSLSIKFRFQKINPWVEDRSAATKDEMRRRTMQNISAGVGRNHVAAEALGVPFAGFVYAPNQYFSQSKHSQRSGSD